MFFRSTDLPVPDGPITAVIWPAGSSKVMSSEDGVRPEATW